MFVAMDIDLVVERAGHHTVGFAGTAERAVALADEQRPDLVLMDIRLGVVVTGSTPQSRSANVLTSLP
jgi:CheY-like chemotaxis protein